MIHSDYRVDALIDGFVSDVSKRICNDLSEKNFDLSLFEEERLSGCAPEFKDLLDRVKTKIHAKVAKKAEAKANKSAKELLSSNHELSIHYMDFITELNFRGLSEKYSAIMAEKNRKS